MPNKTKLSRLLRVSKDIVKARRAGDSKRQATRKAVNKAIKDKRY